MSHVNNDSVQPGGIAAVERNSVECQRLIFEFLHPSPAKDANSSQGQDGKPFDGYPGSGKV